MKLELNKNEQLLIGFLLEMPPNYMAHIYDKKTFWKVAEWR